MKRKAKRSAAPPKASSKVASFSMPVLSPAWRRGLVAAGLVLAVLLVYIGVCLPGTSFFNMDDAAYVFANPRLAQGLSGDNISWASTAVYYYAWHPLVWLSYFADYELFGLNPEGYHLTSVLWHAANAVLLMFVLESLTRRFWPSALVAALFALHPVRVESVAWVAERKDVLSGFFWIATMGLYGWYVGRPSLGRYLLTTLAFVAGLMSKPMVVTLPCVLLLLDYWPLRRWPVCEPGKNGRRAAWLLLEKLPWLLLAAGISYITARAQGVHLQPELGESSLWQRLLGAALAYVGYLWQAFWPLDLAPLYTRPTSVSLVASGGAALALLVAITAFVLFQARRRPYLPVGWLWFLGTLVPVIGLVPVGMQSMADRYQYLPQIGLLLMIVWGLDELMVGRVAGRSLAVVCGLVLAALASLTFQQALLWRDPETMWRHAVKVTRDNFGAHDLLGQTLTMQGANQEAVAEYRKALALEPNFARALVHLGTAQLGQGDYAGAAENFRKVLARFPDNAEAHAGLGRALMQLSEMEEAIAHLEAVTRAMPESAFAHLNLATALLHRGRLPEADSSASSALARQPNLAEAHGVRGTVLALQGQPQAAEAAFRAAEAAAPSPGGAFGLAWALQARGKTEAAQAVIQKAKAAYPKWAELFAKKSWPLATDADARRRYGPLALHRAELIALAAGQEAFALDFKAAALAELGRYTEAVKVAKEAQAAAASDAKLRAAIGVRLQGYERGQPWREPSHP